MTTLLSLGLITLTPEVMVLALLWVFSLITVSLATAGTGSGRFSNRSSRLGADGEVSSSSTSSSSDRGGRKSMAVRNNSSSSSSVFTDSIEETVGIETSVSTEQSTGVGGI